MRPHLSMLTLPTRDIERAVDFYTQLGLPLLRASRDGIALFGLGALTLALCDESVLAHELGSTESSDPSAASRVVLSHNVTLEAEVDELLLRAAAVGADIVRPASRASWGGRRGFFRDLDGHLWEVVHNPNVPLDAQGGLRWPFAHGREPSDPAS